MSKKTAIKGNERVSIFDVPSGLNNNQLICECCGESLIAKKGDTNRHHFAHKANSQCVYNKNANGSGGVGAAHINAQEKIYKYYNDYKISIRIKCHPIKCSSGSMCRTWGEFDLKKRFPPSEYIMEIEYYYRTNGSICQFDIAILSKTNITAPPVYNIEILDTHATKEEKRMNVEWVEISAKEVNDKIVYSGDIKPILIYECKRNDNTVDNKCDNCVQYQRKREQWIQEQQEQYLQRQQEQEEYLEQCRKKRERERREREQKYQEQEEKEQREREQREKEQREREQREKEQREREQREREQREKEKQEEEKQKHIKWLEWHNNKINQNNEKKRVDEEKMNQQRQRIESLSNQLFERNPELFKTKDSPHLIGKYEKIAKKEIKSCVACKSSKRCLTCNLRIARCGKELLLSDLLIQASK
jgi:hypothetical protein